MIRRKLITATRAGLAELADPVKAPQMQAYMKSAMPYYGVQTTPRRKLSKRLAKEIQLETFDDWRDTLLAMWRSARFREERYVVLDLVDLPRYEDHQTLDALPMYEEMITTGAWWDLVDGIAGHRLRRLLEKYPKAMTRRMLTWSKCDDMWKRRSAIICQLGRKGETDLDLLYRCIEPNTASKEFFLRKAIGWALRDYAWHDPDEVKRYVEEQGEALSGLSRREALKNV